MHDKAIELTTTASRESAARLPQDDDTMVENYAAIAVDEEEFASTAIDAVLLDSTENNALLSPSSPADTSELPGSAFSPTNNNARLYFQRLARVYSTRYLVFLGLTQVLICGVFAGLIGACFLPVFQGLGVDAATEQVLVLVCTLPYTAVPLMGIISDLLPLGGYHKRYWIVLAIGLGAFGSASLIREASEISEKSITGGVSTMMVVIGLTSMNLELAVLNLLNEGKYSEIMRDHPESGADIVTFNQGCSALGSLLAMSFVGPLSDTGNLKAMFTIAAVLGLSPLVPILLGWLPENKRFPGENGLLVGYGSCIMIDVDKLSKQKQTIGIALLVGVGGPVLAVVSAYVNRPIGTAVVVLLFLVVLMLSYCMLPRVIADVVAYTIITKSSAPSLRSALQYFYTADDECLPGGPHFSYTYYITYNGIVGEIFMLTAIVFYQYYMSNWSYRSVLLTTLVLASAGRLVDVILVMRWNLLLGIPDHVFFLFGSSMLESMTSMLHLLPFSAIISKVCPSGTETATFAFVAGVSSFSSTFSSMAGSALMDFAGLKTVSPACDFSSLPMLIVALAIFLPLALGIPAIFIFIPEALQSDPLVPATEAVYPGEHRLLSNDDEEQMEGFPSKRRRQQKMKIPHLLGPVACLLIFITTTKSTMPSVFVEAVAVASIPRSKNCLWPGGGGGGFSWEASVDPNTGTASSREVTRAPPNSRICQQLLRDPKELQQSVDTEGAWSDIRYKLEHYPQWLERGSITLGLFRAVLVPGEKGSSSCSLQDRFFGINLLIFGSIASHVQTKQRLPRFLQILKQNLPPERACLGHCTVTFPIVGGLLAAQKETHKKGDALGYLQFTLQQNKSKRNNVLDDKQIGGGEVVITTKIKNYSPMLVGTREPPRLLRKVTYLSTQSIFHAYVMWRFHKYCIHSERSYPPPM